MQQVARRISSGVRPEVDLDGRTGPASVMPLARRHHLLAAISACFGLNAATAKRAARHRLAHVRGRLEEPGQIVQHLLGPRAGQDGHQRAGRRRCCSRNASSSRCCSHFVEERMADERGVAAALAEPLFLERQAAQHVVAQPPHLLRPPRGPGPDLRRRIVEDRNAVDLGPPGDPPIEAGIVDQHDAVGPLVAEIAVGPAGQVPELGRLASARTNHITASSVRSACSRQPAAAICGPP